MTAPTRTEKQQGIDSEQGMMILLFVIVALGIVGVFLAGG